LNTNNINTNRKKNILTKSENKNIVTHRQYEIQRMKFVKMFEKKLIE